MNNEDQFIGYLINVGVTTCRLFGVREDESLKELSVNSYGILPENGTADALIFLWSAGAISAGSAGIFQESVSTGFKADYQQHVYADYHRIYYAYEAVL